MKKKSVILGLVFGLFFLITAAQAGIIEQTQGLK
jgi:outer membrane lipoprotein-sorting protein